MQKNVFYFIYYYLNDDTCHQQVLKEDLIEQKRYGNYLLDQNIGWKKINYKYSPGYSYSIMHDVYAKNFCNGYSLKSNGKILVSGINKLEDKYIINNKGEMIFRAKTYFIKK